MFFGLDVHKESLHVCELGQDGKRRREFRVRADVEAIEAFAATLDVADQLVLEATFHTWVIVRILRPHVSRLDFDDTRVRERSIAGVIAALYSMPRSGDRGTAPLAAGTPGVDCIESLWLENRESLAECNRWRTEQRVTPLSVVEEYGTPILAWP
jgi:hypothetical protein